MKRSISRLIPIASIIMQPLQQGRKLVEVFEASDILFLDFLSSLTGHGSIFQTDPSTFLHAFGQNLQSLPHHLRRNPVLANLLYHNATAVPNTIGPVPNGTVGA
jgi:hypothetical protein